MTDRAKKPGFRTPDPDEKPPVGEHETKAERKARVAEMSEGRGRGRPEGSSPGSAIDQAQRDMRLFQAHLNCVSVADLCEAYGLRPARVREIIKEQRREYQRLSTMNPVEIVEEATAQIDQGLSQLAAAAAKEKGAVRVSAIMGRIDRVLAKMKWLQSTGILPQEAAELRIQVDGMNMAQNVLTVLERNGILTPELMQEIHAEIGGGDIDEDVVDSTAEEMPALEP